MKKEQIRIEISDGASIPDLKDTRLITAWRLAFITATCTLAYLYFAHPEPYRKILLFLPEGILITFQVTICSIICAIPLGLLTGLGRLSEHRIINLIASSYVEIIRGIPLLVQLVYIYYALGRFLQVPDIMAAIIALSICYGAYMGEVFRAGISAVPSGQTEASRSLGFSKRQTMFLIVLPQAWKTILPPVGNEFIALLKDTSLISVIAIADILRRGQEYTSETFEYFETYTVVALVYLIITLMLSKCVAYMEGRLNYYADK